MDYNKIKSLIPNGITAIRIILTPILLYTYFMDLKLAAVGIFILAVLTDAIDGYVARELSSTSFWGVYFDVTADFILIFAVFIAFVAKDVYPYWILFVILFMFMQFIFTSKTKILSYDPVGKYYGSFLFLTIFLTLITSNNSLYLLLLFFMVLFTIISIASRLFYFLVQGNR